MHVKQGGRTGRSSDIEFHETLMSLIAGQGTLLYWTKWWVGERTATGSVILVNQKCAWFSARQQCFLIQPVPAMWCSHWFLLHWPGLALGTGRHKARPGQCKWDTERFSEDSTFGATGFTVDPLGTCSYWLLPASEELCNEHDTDRSGLLERNLDLLNTGWLERWTSLSRPEFSRLQLVRVTHILLPIQNPGVRHTSV